MLRHEYAQSLSPDHMEAMPNLPPRKVFIRVPEYCQGEGQVDYTEYALAQCGNRLTAEHSNLEVVVHRSLVEHSRKSFLTWSQRSSLLLRSGSGNERGPFGTPIEGVLRMVKSYPRLTVVLDPCEGWRQHMFCGVEETRHPRIQLVAKCAGLCESKDVFRIASDQACESGSSPCHDSLVAEIASLYKSSTA